MITIYEVGQTLYGAWVIYGSEGFKVYDGYELHEALRLYKTVYKKPKKERTKSERYGMANKKH